MFILANVAVVEIFSRADSKIPDFANGAKKKIED